VFSFVDSIQGVEGSDRHLWKSMDWKNWRFKRPVSACFHNILSCSGATYLALEDGLLVTRLHMAADSTVESLNSWIQRTLFSRNQQQQRVDWSGPCDRLL
jgi:hypothetical protein